jgi:copper homeostasis protein
MTAFELAVQDPHGLAVAARVRPDRMELCSALSTGGVTPSAGFVEAAVATGVPVHVLIRPREGGFSHSADETALILADVRHALRLGAAGVVIGGLLADGSVDGELVRRARDLAGDAEVTFHRAFDQTADLDAGLEALIDAGAARVLTSGGRASAAEALDVFPRLVARAAGRIQVMAGAGVTSENAAAIAATGVDAVHASAKRTVVETLAVSLGAAAAAGQTRYATADESEAAAIRELLGPAL